MVESVTWDEGAYTDLDAAERIARQIVANGLSYKGLSPAEAKTLDKIVTGFFCPEGLEECLGFEYESPDGLHLNVVKELIERSRDVNLPFLNLLTTGRRLNDGGVPDARNRYLILTPAEVLQLRAETQHLLDVPTSWSSTSVSETVRSCFLNVLSSVASKHRSLAGRHC